MNRTISFLALLGAMIAGSSAVYAKDDSRDACKDLPTYDQLKVAMDASDATTLDNSNPANPVPVLGGLGLNMWGTIVNRDGIVCAVAFTGNDRNDQWPGSRVISAAKANTANAYSLNELALSTALLYASGQPGGYLWGLQFGNPIDTENAYKGNPKNYGQHNDPMVGKRVGGQIVFGGGFALYNKDGKIIGALGVSGDTSCKDHNFGWFVRNNLKLDFTPNNDNIKYDMGDSEQGNIVSDSSLGHVDCGNGESAIAASLPINTTFH